MTVTACLGPQGTFAEQAARVLVPGGELRSAVSVHAAIAALRARVRGPRTGESRPGPDPTGFTGAREWLSAVRAGRSA